jgi:hypothetical protein
LYLNHVHPGNHDHNVNEIPRDWDLVLNSNYTPPSFEKAAIDFKVAASDQNDPWDCLQQYDSDPQ